MVLNFGLLWLTLLLEIMNTLYRSEGAVGRQKPKIKIHVLDGSPEMVSAIYGEPMGILSDFLSDNVKNTSRGHA